MEIDIQAQYDLIYSFFSATTEPFDDLEWDTERLIVYLDNEKIEEYTYLDLKQLIANF